MTNKVKIAGEEEIAEHINYCVQYFYDKYINNLEFVPQSVHESFDFDINLYALAEAIEDARVDLDRWTKFHLIGDKKPDNHKYAGFLSKWIARRRPVQVILKDKNCTPELPDALYKINATFALIVFRSLLKKEIPVALVRELIYKFHYRDPSGEALAVLAYCCEEITEKREEIISLEGILLGEINVTPQSNLAKSLGLK